MQLAAGIAALTLAYPRASFPEGSVQLYARMLADLAESEVAEAIERLIRRSTFLPTIAEIRTEVIDARLGLPTAEEAWEIVTRGSVKDAPEELRIALESAGGRWSVMHAENPEVVRAQFTKDYASRRNRSIQIASGAVVASNIVSLVTRRPLRALEASAALPESTRIAPRPVMMRLMRRRSGRVLGDPSDPERADAILVLHDGPQAFPDEPEGHVDPLFEEAQRIMDESTALAAV